VIHQKTSDPMQLHFGVVMFDPQSEFALCRELKNYELFHGLSLFQWFSDQTPLHLDASSVRLIDFHKFSHWKEFRLFDAHG
jgi:hypothetical protein